TCRKEATYADKRQKQINAIYVDDDYEAEEWLDIRLTGTYIRFGKKLFDDAVSRLLNYIPKSNESLIALVPQIIQHEVTSQSPIVQQPSEQKEQQSTTSLMNKPVQNWTKQDIDAWFNEHHLLPQLYSLYSFEDGAELYEYATAFNDNILDAKNKKLKYENLCASIKSQFGVRFEDYHYAKLVTSMKKLITDNSQANFLRDNPSSV
ncbi:unnamed protein product, partial [Didymodactylos carnosus]